MRETRHCAKQNSKIETRWKTCSIRSFVFIAFSEHCLSLTRIFCVAFSIYPLLLNSLFHFHFSAVIFLLRQALLQIHFLMRLARCMPPTATSTMNAAKVNVRFRSARVFRCRASSAPFRKTSRKGMTTSRASLAKASSTPISWSVAVK